MGGGGGRCVGGERLAQSRATRRRRSIDCPAVSASLSSPELSGDPGCDEGNAEGPDTGELGGDAKPHPTLDALLEASEALGVSSAATAGLQAHRSTLLVSESFCIGDMGVLLLTGRSGGGVGPRDGSSGSCSPAQTLQVGSRSGFRQRAHTGSAHVAKLAKPPAHANGSAARCRGGGIASELKRCCCDGTATLIQSQSDADSVTVTFSETSWEHKTADKTFSAASMIDWEAM